MCFPSNNFIIIKFYNKMNSRILTSIVSAAGEGRSADEAKRRAEAGRAPLQELMSSVKNCQSRFGGKSELATEDDIRIVQLCEKWEAVLSHGVRTTPAGSSLQGLVQAGLSFTFNINTVGQTLWSYACLHLTKHEKERFTMLRIVNTPLGYFRAYLRASLNERSLERYLHSWLSHGLLAEYYELGSLCRDSESSNLLPSMAAGLSSILFSLSIDKAELNESQQTQTVDKVEHLIPLPAPIKTNNNTRRKPLRQVISFDKNENADGRNPTRRKSMPQPPDNDLWRSAPATCLNSPDPKLVQKPSSSSEPATSDFKNIRQFFPDTTKLTDSPSQILSRLSERAKEIFSSSHSVDLNYSGREDSSDLSINNLRISESDSEEVAGSIDGSVSHLELCFEEEPPAGEEGALRVALARHEREYLALQIKHSQTEIANREKIKKLEIVILDLSKENESLKEQLRKYMSAVEIGNALKSNSSEPNDEIIEYEKKLVQVAEMHAELMEFNQHLQRRLQEAENVNSLEIMRSDIPTSNVKVFIPAAFLVGHKTHSYHVYQIFVKVGAEEWNVYHRYAKFRELHIQLGKCHQDIATFKFPPKKALGKKEAWVVEARRAALQAYLRHILVVVPELRTCSSRAQLLALLPFFGASSTSLEGNGSNRLTRLFMSRSHQGNTATTPTTPNSYAAL